MSDLSKSQNIFELKIIHWNCFKMTKTRLYEFKLVLELFQPVIISVQEIKMNQAQSDLFLRFDGYKVYYKPRKNSDICQGVN
jgi:hypothetical protein